MAQARQSRNEVLDLAAAGVAALLRERGLRPGDRAGIMLPNVAEFAAVYYGVLRVGGVVAFRCFTRSGRPAPSTPPWRRERA